MVFNHKRADFWLPNFGFERSLLSLLNFICKGANKVHIVKSLKGSGTDTVVLTTKFFIFIL